MAFKRVVQIRMDDDLFSKFNYYCKKKGLSKSEVIRRYILTLDLDEISHKPWKDDFYDKKQ